MKEAEAEEHEWCLYTKPLAHMGGNARAGQMGVRKRWGLTMVCGLVERKKHGEWEACLWGTQNALARLSRRVGGGKQEKNKNVQPCRRERAVFLCTVCKRGGGALS